MTSNYIITYRAFLRDSAEIGERIINAATNAEMYANVHELSALLKAWDYTHDERRELIRYNMAIYANLHEGVQVHGLWR